MQIVHLTDPHLTPLNGLLPNGFKGVLSWLSWQTRRRHRHFPGHLDRLVDHLRQTDPDLWAITGDLCQTGRRREIECARKWLRSVADASQVLLVPGNHDIFDTHSEEIVRERWGSFLHLSEPGGEWPVLRRIDSVSLIALNSAVVTQVGSAQGALGAPQLRRLDEMLESERGRCRVLLIHHPPDAEACKPRKRLQDAAALSELLGRHQPALVLHGHVHRNRSISVGETRILGTGSASAGGKLGAASARRITIDTSRTGGFRLQVGLMALDAQHGRLEEIEREEWSGTG